MGMGGGGLVIDVAKKANNVIRVSWILQMEAVCGTDGILKINVEGVCIYLAR